MKESDTFPFFDLNNFSMDLAIHIRNIDRSRTYKTSGHDAREKLTHEFEEYHIRLEE